MDNNITFITKTAMEKRMIDRFAQDFESSLSPEITKEAAFKEAKKKFENVCGFTPYRSYKSFTAARYQDRSKWRK